MCNGWSRTSQGTEGCTGLDTCTPRSKVTLTTASCSHAAVTAVAIPPTVRVKVVVVVRTALFRRGSGSGLVPAEPPVPGHVTLRS